MVVILLSLVDAAVGAHTLSNKSGENYSSHFVEVEIAANQVIICPADSCEPLNTLIIIEF